MTQDQLYAWRRLLGIRDTDNASEADEAIKCEHEAAASAGRRARVNNIRAMLGLARDERYA